MHARIDLATLRDGCAPIINETSRVIVVMSYHNCIYADIIRTLTLHTQTARTHRTFC